MKSQRATSKPTPPSDLWQQMDALLGARLKDDPGFTTQEFSSRYRLSDSHARKKINELVRQGALVEGRRKYNNRLIKVFRPA